MRVISGKLKGRSLLSFNAPHIRPTTDRVKESIFNRLVGEVEGAQVLDLFGGTGNLSFESYSRGAEHVTLVELNKKSIQIIKKNIIHFNIPINKLQIVQKDVLRFLKNPPDEQFDLIFIDPPFTKKMAHEVMTALSQTSIFHEGTMIIIESSSQEKIEDNYGELNLEWQKKFGDKWVSFFTL